MQLLTLRFWRMQSKRFKLSEFNLSWSIIPTSKILLLASIKVFMYHVFQIVKSCICCEENYFKKVFNFPSTFEQGTTKLICKISRMLYPMRRKSNTIKLDITWSLNFSQGLNIKMKMQFSLYKSWIFWNLCKTEKF